jgi:hypothetical protein
VNFPGVAVVVVVESGTVVVFFAEVNFTEETPEIFSPFDAETVTV